MSTATTESMTTTTTSMQLSSPTHVTEANSICPQTSLNDFIQQWRLVGCKDKVCHIKYKVEKMCTIYSPDCDLCNLQDCKNISVAFSVCSSFIFFLLLSFDIEFLTGIMCHFGLPRYCCMGDDGYHNCWYCIGF